MKTGAPGIIGSPGPSGVQGIEGSPGPSGAPGMEGSQGPSGAAGKESLIYIYTNLIKITKNSRPRYSVIENELCNGLLMRDYRK